MEYCLQTDGKTISGPHQCTWLCAESHLYPQHRSKDLNMTCGCWMAFKVVPVVPTCRNKALCNRHGVQMRDRSQPLVLDRGMGVARSIRQLFAADPAGCHLRICQSNCYPFQVLSSHACVTGRGQQLLFQPHGLANKARRGSKLSSSEQSGTRSWTNLEDQSLFIYSCHFTTRCSATRHSSSSSTPLYLGSAVPLENTQIWATHSQVPSRPSTG